jgi:hypothetical protein
MKTLCMMNRITELNWIVERYRILGTEFVITSDMISDCCRAGCYEVLQLFWSLRNEFQFNYNHLAFDNSCVGNPKSLDIVKWWFDRMNDGLELKSSKLALQNAFNYHNLDVINYLFDNRSLFDFQSVCIEEIPNQAMNTSWKLELLDWLWDHRDDVKIEYSNELFNTLLLYPDIMVWYMLHVNLGMQCKYNKKYIVDMMNCFIDQGHYIFQIECLIKHFDLFPPDLKHDIQELLADVKDVYQINFGEYELKIDE